MATLSSLTLEIHGRNLSKDATFQIDGEDVTLNMLAEGSGKDRRPEIVARDDQAQNPGIAKILKLTIDSPKEKWLTPASSPDESKRKHMLTFVNPDGQKADWPFTIG
jgi:hypothetical protein